LQNPGEASPRDIEPCLFESKDCSLLEVPLLAEYHRTLRKFGGVEFFVRSSAPVQHQFIPQTTQLCRHDRAMHCLQSRNEPSPDTRSHTIGSGVRTAGGKRAAPMDMKHGHGHFSSSGERAG
jgi:hypothetical protein